MNPKEEKGNRKKGKTKENCEERTQASEREEKKEKDGTIKNNWKYNE